jgi:hypothetical protein
VPLIPTFVLARRTLFVKMYRIVLIKCSLVGIGSLIKQAERSRGEKAETRVAVKMAGNLGIKDPQVNHHPILRVRKIKPRTGLRMRGQRGHPEVRRALNQYARWLRKAYAFPIRVPVYLFPSRTIITQDGVRVVASFFAPFDRDAEPFIRIATGDYPELKRLRGRNDALAAIIMSLSHEIVHYYQWLESGEISERGVIVKSRSMLRRYAAEVKRP